MMGMIISYFGGVIPALMPELEPVDMPTNNS
jgi:hypothetical protein